MKCLVDWCENEAVPKRAGYCWGCYAYKWRTGKDPSNRDPHRHSSDKERLFEAIKNYSDVDALDDDEYRRAWDRLRKAMWDYVLARTGKKRPPKDDVHPDKQTSP